MVLGAGDEEDIAKVVDALGGAQAIEEGLSRVGMVAQAQLQQRARLLQLLQSPHAHRHQARRGVQGTQVRPTARQEGVQPRVQ